MKKIVFGLMALGFASAGFAAGGVATWHDPNGTVWTMAAGRTTHERAEVRCEVMGFGLPDIDDLLEAFEMGLADPRVNTAFGVHVSRMDWAWTRTSHPAPSRFFYIVSRWGDSAPVPANERHFVLCAK